MKKWISFILAMMMVFTLAACGTSAPAGVDGSADDNQQTDQPTQADAQPDEAEPAEVEPAETEPTEVEPAQAEPAEIEPAEEEDGQPQAGDVVDVQRFIGLWEYDRLSLEISPSPTDDQCYRCLVGWGSSAFERTVWEYQCYFDDTALYSFENGTKTNLVWNDEGELDSQEVIFSDGAARFELTDDGDLIWQEFKEDTGAGMVFEHVDVPVPTPDALVDGYFHVIGGYEAGTAGSSISEALSACAAIRFASVNALWATDVPTFRENMLAAWESMTEEEQEHFDANFVDVIILIDNCVQNWDENKGVFEDGGVAEDMEMLLGDPNALNSWYTLRDNTLTLGNSDGE